MMKINWSHEAVVSKRMIFCETISEISNSRLPVYYKFLLTNTIFDLVEVHIHYFSAFVFDGGGSETDNNGIVRLYWSRCLTIPDSLKCFTD